MVYYYRYLFKNKRVKRIFKPVFTRIIRTGHSHLLSREPYFYQVRIKGKQEYTPYMKTGRVFLDNTEHAARE